MFEKHIANIGLIIVFCVWFSIFWHTQKYSLKKENCAEFTLIQADNNKLPSLILYRKNYSNIILPSIYQYQLHDQSNRGNIKQRIFRAIRCSLPVVVKM